MTRCCICGGTASGTHDPVTDRWYCLKPECVKQTPAHITAGFRDAKPLRASDFDPEAVRLHQHVQALASRDSASGDITRGRGFIGVREDGTRAPGAVDWHYRPVPVDKGGRLIMALQQDTPIHFEGAVFAEPKQARRTLREISEEQAQREILQAALKEAGGDVMRLPADQIAAALAMTPSRIGKRVRREKRRARAA